MPAQPMTAPRTSHDPPLTRPATAPPSLLGGSLLVSALAQFSLSADTVLSYAGLRAEALKLLWRLWWQSHQPCESPRRFKACLRLPWCDQPQKKVN
jgi:hypothetical protein